VIAIAQASLASTAVLAQFAAGGYSLLQILVLVIVIAAAIAITYVILGQMGVAIPAWAIRIFWVLVLAFVGIAALYFLFSMVGQMR
jgi:hypothetical protein